jgi:hypothetical protein
MYLTWPNADCMGKVKCETHKDDKGIWTKELR